MQFKENSDANADGTSFRINFTAAPCLVTKTFGISLGGDEFKVSHEWIFQAIDDPSVVFTLYSWKNTSLYDLGYQSPNNFIISEYPYAWHIGATDNNTKYLIDFTMWLNKELNK